MLERGVVIFYSGQPKKFGFIQPDTVPANDRTHNVFFHLNHQFSYVCDGSDVPGQIHTDREPQLGDRVMFTGVDEDRGRKAIRWAFEETYTKAIQDIANRPTLRLRKRNGAIPISRLQERPTYETLWQGIDVADLRKKYPKYHYPLYSNPHAHVAIILEQLNDNKEWLVCKVDPR